MELNILTYQEKHRNSHPQSTMGFISSRSSSFKLAGFGESNVAQPSAPAVGVSEKGICISGDGNQPASAGAGGHAQKPHTEISGHFYKAEASSESCLSLPAPPSAV